MQAPLLSIVVPVYKVEDTIDRCVESILAQGLDCIEIILVDDGSLDNCLVLCDNWAARDSRIKVIHKRNGGLSDARNVGIDTAQGEYVTFVDSDDYLAPNTFSPLLQLLQKESEVDVLEFPVQVLQGSSGEHLLVLPEATFRSATHYWRTTEGWQHAYAWNKIFRRSLFASIRFPVGLKFEDIHTIPHLLAKARAIRTTQHGLYHYLFNPNGITANADAAAYQSFLQAHLNLLSNPAFNAIDDERYRLALLNIQIYAHELSGIPPQMPYIPFRKILTSKTILYNLLRPNLLCHLNRAMRRIIPRK